MSVKNPISVAWLLPSMERQNYWQPLFKEFTKTFPKTQVYTGFWEGFVPGLEDAFTVEVVGKTKFVPTTQGTGYSPGFISLSPKIIVELFKFQPQVIFVSGFSLWTLLSLVFKPLGRWKVIIVYDGSSPTIDYINSRRRLILRSTMVRLADAYITNTNGGKNYLTKILGAEEHRVFARPYQVPDVKTLLGQQGEEADSEPEYQRPIFLFVGKLIPRKGLRFLLEACTILKQQGYQNYAVLIVGDGEQREELEIYSQNQGLTDCLRWVGWGNYDKLGAYFRQADVFVFPTLEDIWGVVLLEAMAFGQPILCSKWAGSSELVVEGENGYIFDPYHPEELAKHIKCFIDNPDLIISMGQQSQQLIAQHNPEAAANFLIEVTSFALNQ
ncbi:MAG: glycosyltransferase family 4 protein [Coleofasciculus chthonoplastes F3-SA18-01]|uniref:glycosyltransferase family 4 protein n=1 Tax=Coleofasciculus chthonoplastes TaxID=64178 RepID=UPI0032F53168